MRGKKGGREAYWRDRCTGREFEYPSDIFVADLFNLFRPVEMREDGIPNRVEREFVFERLRFVKIAFSAPVKHKPEREKTP